MKKASRSNRNKRSVHEMLAEDAEVENKMLDKLSNQKHERHLALKCQKLETQAAMSRQAAEERQQAAKHQWEQLMKVNGARAWVSSDCSITLQLGYVNMRW